MFQTVVSPREVILMHRNSGEYTEVPKEGRTMEGMLKTNLTMLFHCFASDLTCKCTTILGSIMKEGAAHYA